MKENKILTTRELSRYLKLNEKTVLKMAQSGRLPGAKIGNRWRFYVSAIDEYLQDSIVRCLDYNINELVKVPDIMPLSRLVEPSCIKLGLESRSKKAVLYELAQIARSAEVAVSAEEVFKHLQKRERMLSTAVKEGIAIPHPRNPSEGLFRKPGVIIARSIKGVDFSAPGGEKTHLFFMPCAPDVVWHLKLLSKISRLLQGKNIFQKFMKAKSKDSIIKILLESEKRQIC